MKLFDKVRATMKSKDVEGPFELYVTRTPGYLWACLFKVLHIHPIAVTLMSIVLGVASGWFFYSKDLEMNLIGMLLLIWGNWFDCADGQLARMTGKKTLIGRILDGFAGDLWFFSIYFFICLRLQDEMIPVIGRPWGIWIWLLAAYSGLWCHVRQCNVSDYYRNYHMYFELGDKRAEFDNTENLQKQYNSLKWLSGDWFQKIYLFFYIQYTGRQEHMAPWAHNFVYRITRRYASAENIPQEWRDRVCRRSKPMMPLANICTFDTRVIVLFITLAIGQPWIYFVFEGTVLEAIKIYMVRVHEKFSHSFFEMV